MSGKFLSNTILLRNSAAVIDVTNCKKSSALITEENCVKEVDIFYSKQIRSWSTNSWDIFTAGAVREPMTDNIYAVVNNCILWKWQLTDQSLSKVKPVTFKYGEIKKLVIVNNVIFVLFTTGLLQPLSDAIHLKKTHPLRIIGTDEIIQQIKLDSYQRYVLLTISKDCRKWKLYIICIMDSCIDGEPITFESENICQCYIVSSMLITLYSNGHVHCTDIYEHNGKFPGPMKSKISLINATKGVNIMEAGDHAVFQGKATDDEGDYLILWNYKYYMAVDVKKIKISLDTPKGWSLNRGLALMEGHTLGHVTLQLKETTAALMMGIAAKGRTCNAECLNIGQLSIAAGTSSPDYTSVESIKEIISKNKILHLCSWLKRSCYISEEVFVLSLKFFLEVENKHFNSIPESYFKNYDELLTLEKYFYKDDRLPYGRIKFTCLNFLLTTPYTASYLLKEIWTLELGTVEKLLEHLHSMLKIIQFSTLSLQGLNLTSISKLIDVVLKANFMKLSSSFDTINLIVKIQEEYEMLDQSVNKLDECKAIIEDRKPKAKNNTISHAQFFKPSGFLM